MRATPRGRQYTLILIGDASTAVRRFHLPERRVRIAGAALVALALVGAGILAHYTSVLASRASTRVDARAVREENELLRAQLRSVEDRIAHITATLDRVQQVDATLRGTVKKLQGSSSASGTPATPTAPSAALAPGMGVGGPVTDVTDLSGQLASLDRAAAHQETSLRGLNEYFEAQRSLLASTPNAWPARGWVTSDFGERLDPYTAERMEHRGLDIATQPGNPVLAPSDGTVTFAGDENGYGKVLVLDHGHGVNTRYGHLSAIYVKAGQRVKRGARVAAVGNTGRSTGPHLHYEVRVNGAAENPRKFLME
jgi:murein DD-endopeptidase MepM/ murein hydrolase activator NlpD